MHPTCYFVDWIVRPGETATAENSGRNLRRKTSTA
jgi:hypothetical protein